MATIWNDIANVFQIESLISEPLICCCGCCPLSQAASSAIHMLPTFHFGTSKVRRSAITDKSGMLTRHHSNTDPRSSFFPFFLAFLFSFIPRFFLETGDYPISDNDSRPPQEPRCPRYACHWDLPLLYFTTHLSDNPLALRPSK